MSTKDHPSQRWFASWRLARQPVSVDAADYGTAFGLDMSLDDDPPEAPPAPAVDRRPGWVRRLSRRRPSPT
jgi:hypothetical protein